MEHFLCIPELGLGYRQAATSQWTNSWDNAFGIRDFVVVKINYRRCLNHQKIFGMGRSDR